MSALSVEQMGELYTLVALKVTFTEDTIVGKDFEDIETFEKLRGRISFQKNIVPFLSSDENKVIKKIYNLVFPTTLGNESNGNGSVESTADLDHMKKAIGMSDVEGETDSQIRVLLIREKINDNTHTLYFINYGKPWKTIRGVTFGTGNKLTTYKQILDKIRQNIMLGHAINDKFCEGCIIESEKKLRETLIYLSQNLKIE